MEVLRELLLKQEEKSLFPSLGVFDGVLVVTIGLSHYRHGVWRKELFAMLCASDRTDPGVCLSQLNDVCPRAHYSLCNSVIHLLTRKSL